MFDLKKFQKLEELSGKLEKLLCEFEALCDNDETPENEAYGELVSDLYQAWVWLDMLDEFAYSHLTKEE